MRRLTYYILANLSNVFNRRGQKSSVFVFICQYIAFIKIVLNVQCVKGNIGILTLFITGKMT